MLMISSLQHHITDNYAHLVAIYFISFVYTCACVYVCKIVYFGGEAKPALTLWRMKSTFIHEVKINVY